MRQNFRQHFQKMSSAAPDNINCIKKKVVRLFEDKKVCIAIGQSWLIFVEHAKKPRIIQISDEPDVLCIHRERDRVTRQYSTVCFERVSRHTLEQRSHDNFFKSFGRKFPRNKNTFSVQEHFTLSSSFDYQFATNASLTI